MKKLFTLATTLAFAAALHAADLGKPAPDFTAKDLDGKPVKLSDFKGKIVVLEAYNYDCPFCANHFNNGAMQQLQGDLKGKGVVWLLVNSVNPAHPSHRTAEQAKKEMAEHHIKSATWLDDSDGKIGKLYGMKTTPHMFVIGADGNLAYQGAIDDNASPKHDPRAARNYVREAVTALLDGKPVTTPETKPYGCSVKYAE
jgi:peroxiredoxin